MPELGGENGIAIRHHGLWHAMKPNDLGEERLSHGLRGVGVGKRDEVGVFAQTVHHREDDRLASHHGKSFHEVEANVTPPYRGHREG